MTLTDEFFAARRVSTPIVVIRTTDAASVMSSLTDSAGITVQWDAAQGFAARTELGSAAIAEMTDGNPQVLNPADAMFQLSNVQSGSIVFVLNAHRIWQDIATVQAIWNLRDRFKSNGRTLVLLTTPEATLPRELDSDVIVIDDTLPGSDALAQIVTTQYDNVEPPLPLPDTATLRKAVDALKGLSTFVAEQVVAMCLTRSGIDMDQLWERKRQAVEQTPGATVFRKRISFKDIGGHDGLKRDLLREVTSKRPVKVVVIFDEFEKSMAGSSGDTSGVSQDASKVVLTYMQDNDVRGTILFGHPGAGKTLVAKAMATEADCLCIMADMGAMKGSLVGESEAKIRQFFNTVSAIAGEGGAFFVATCNSTGALTTEMRRRFKTGFYFVDLPTRQEKDLVWDIHMHKRCIQQELPDDTNWTGAEIESCCEKADNYDITLIEAAQSIVPIAKAQPELIDGRRSEANRRLLSSTTGKAYVMPAISLNLQRRELTNTPNVSSWVEMDNDLPPN